jgi:hypothetical protein
MLRAVRGLIVVLFLLGLIASALPYISAASFGPMMQVVAGAGASGNLSRVWDRTCIVISHDMDFIAAVADRILVLEHGHIAQVGDHHALMAEGGLYKRLYEAQNVDPDLVYPTPSDAEVG